MQNFKEMSTGYGDAIMGKTRWPTVAMFVNGPESKLTNIKYDYHVPTCFMPNLIQIPA